MIRALYSSRWPGPALVSCSTSRTFVCFAILARRYCTVVIAILIMILVLGLHHVRMHTTLVNTLSNESVPATAPPYQKQIVEAT